jgi:uncharacterized protein (DUF2141 family)
MRKSRCSTAIAFGFAIGVLVATTAAQAQSATLTVNVTGVRNSNGNVRCGLYASAETFPKAGQEYRGIVGRINGQQATCVFGNLAAGTYAVAAFHAEQGETQMQYGMFGKPKEGYGFSRNPSSSFGAPSFSAAAFNFSGNQTLQVTLQY